MAKSTRFLLFFFCALTIAGGCGRLPARPTSYRYQKPQATGDGLITDDLRGVGMDSVLICKLTKLILAGSMANVHSLLIAKDGRLVYEAYFAGLDREHGTGLEDNEYAMRLLHDCRSISKSITAACIGIAIQKGLISGVDDPVSKYIAEVKDSAKSTITIKHLLTMTSGLEWKEIGHYGSFFNSETQMDIRFNPVNYVLKKPMATTPGSTWNYSAGNTQLLAEIIYRTSGLTIDKFAGMYLFNPIGIRNYQWKKLFLKNMPAAASGLRLTPRDLLKFGLLYMSNGHYNNMQLIDHRWIAESIQSHVQRPNFTNIKIKNGGYGYAFWTYTDTVDAKPAQIFEAKGNGGQSILFCPSLNLLIVTTGGNYNKPDDDPYRMLTKFIIPSIVNHSHE